MHNFIHDLMVSSQILHELCFIVFFAFAWIMHENLVPCTIQQKLSYIYIYICSLLAWFAGWVTEGSRHFFFNIFAIAHLQKHTHTTRSLLWLARVKVWIKFLDLALLRQSRHFNRVDFTLCNQYMHLWLRVFQTRKECKDKRGCEGEICILGIVTKSTTPHPLAFWSTVLSAWFGSVGLRP